MNRLRARIDSGTVTRSSAIATIQWPCDQGVVRIIIKTGDGQEIFDAFSLIPIAKLDVGRQVLVLFPHNSASPVISGFLWSGEAADVKAEATGFSPFIVQGPNLTLQWGESRMELSKWGRIRFEGRELEIKTQEETRIASSMIKLN